MGTWNTKIDGNDTFQDVYQNFFDAYNKGQEPSEISKQINFDFAEMFEDYDDRNNSLFALALAQWETKSVEEEIYNKVKEIIESNNDLDVWRGLGADEKTIRRRKIILNKFLAKISTEKEKPKCRVRTKFEFEMINLVNEIAPDDLKKFVVNEEYSNKEYVHTSGLIIWEQGGGSILYFNKQGENISAKWLDNKTLEITCDKSMPLTMQNDSAYFCGDDIKIIYKLA